MLAAADNTAAVARLGNSELMQSLERVLSQERGLHVQLLVHIAEVDARGLYREHACSSMFEYCVQALHMSEAEAYLRIRAARFGRKFPRVWRMLQAGELHLSGLKLLAAELNDDNADELLEAARGKSKREIELLLAARFQKPDVTAVIRKLPERAPAPAADAPMSFTLALEAQAPRPAAERTVDVPSAETSTEPRLSLQPPTSASAKPVLAPLSPGRYKVQLTANQQLHDKLQQARDLMRHELPDGDLAQIVEQALDLLIAQRMKRFGVGCKPRARKQGTSAPKPGSRHIPRTVQREVLARDGLQCAFVSAEGRRCRERGRLQLHHEQPFGRGGPATTDNIWVFCAAHNGLLAERDYGRDYIHQRIERARSERQSRRLGPEPATGPDGP